MHKEDAKDYINRRHIGTGRLLGVSPFIVLGIFLVLVPIFIFITIDNIRELNRRVTEHFTGKGEALIRSFEASTRIGIMSMRWETGRIQRLLTETALQTDIEYIMITDRQGKILAHSDPYKQGQVYAPMPKLSKGFPPLDVLHREVARKISPAAGADQHSSGVLPDEQRIFEVYKQFTPAYPPRGGHRLQYLMDMLDALQRNRSPQDWCDRHFFPGNPPDTRHPALEQIIFVGFNLEQVRALRQQHLWRIVGTGMILLVIGCAGMVSLFTLQAYRSARSSFAKIKAFSDEVVANMPAGLITVADDKRITAVNRKAMEILGIEADDSQGRTVDELFPALRDVVDQVIAKRETISDEVERVDPDGKHVFDVSASPVRGDDGDISGYLILLKDLTDVRCLEREVERSRRFAAIGKLAAGVAHEIRNPLSSIKGFAAYFKEKYSNSPDDQQTAETMTYEVERLNRAVTQLLEFARPVAVEKTDVSPEELVAHSLRLVEADFDKKQITHEAQINTDRDVVRTDRDRMNQVLLNLYLNAIDAMDAGGRLTVTVSDVDGGLAIDVADTGCGIDEKDIDRIFDPYFTTRNTGTGLGLAIVYRLIETLGGEITVDSVSGQGAIFHIRIPC